MSPWERAQRRYEQQTREWRLARDDEARRRTQLQAAAARVELYEVLTADGWKPDAVVEEQVGRDRELLLEQQVADTARAAPEQGDDVAGTG